MKTIPNEALRLDDLPAPDADWTTLWEFAETFEGYTYWGSFERCAEIANRGGAETLTELRTCLFFEYRRWHHFGSVPDDDDEDARSIRGLMAEIRARVAAGLTR